MNLKLTSVLDDVTGVTGLKIIRAILAGERDPQTLATLRDRRCKSDEAEIATALDGRFRKNPMGRLLPPLLIYLSAATDRELARMVRFLKEEHRILRERLCSDST